MFAKSQRYRDAVSILILIGCIWIPAIRLRATNWTPDLDRVELLGILGLAAGLWIGYSSFRKGWAHFLFLLFTFTVPGWLLVSRLENGSDWLPRVFHLEGRLYVSLMQVFSGLPVQDPALFIVFCSFSMWLLGYATGFGFTRSANPWVGLTISTVLFGLIDFYDSSPIAQGWAGVILVFSLFLLAARLFWLKSSQSWEENGFLVERDAGESVLRTTVISAIILVVLAWNLKTIIRSFSPGTMEQQKVSQVWQQIQKQMGNNFAALKPGTFSTGSFAEGMSLGSQAPSSMTPAFQVQLENSAAANPPLYWRARVYDTYQNGMWLSSPVSAEGSQLLSSDYLPDETLFEEVALAVTWNQADGSLVPYPGRLAGTNLAYNLKYFEGDAVLPGDGLLIPDSWLENGDQFTLRSQIFSGKSAELQKIPNDLPDWMRKRYLQLPDTLPASIRSLSENVVVGKTVFDRAQVLTEYLRSQYIYSSQIPDVPSGRDPVEWFLFEQKTGFCNYFASAEVLLLRAAGIPSRLAVGYSQGEKIEGGYQVRLNNGHAWPEVYFQDIGWVPFEPTISQPSLTYSQSAADEVDDLALQLSADERYSAGELGQLNPELDQSGLNENNSQFIQSGSILGLVFLGVLAIVSLYLIRSNKRKPDRISFPQMLLALYESGKIAAPAWLRKWAWYEGLSEPARQYYRLEKLAVAMKWVERTATVPSDLMNELKNELPELTESVNVFQNGLYAEIYSRQKNYDMQNCKTAGAVLQRSMIVRYLRKLLGIR